MSVFLTLTKEHRLFQQLISRLEHSLRYGEDDARAELRRILLVLLPALKRHEQMEDLIFQDPLYRSDKGARRLLVLVEGQHRRIGALHGELLGLLAQQGQVDFRRLRDLMFVFCEKLRLHFHDEETGLWLHYNQTMSRSLEHSINARASQQVRRLEREIRETWSVVSDYV
ncbi:MAG: hemerythrin domain-containing protein [Elusimicrobia bacterium]|nr:hemerythrin domain-containing protein [Elusimicrobiota bacterium]